jgi:rhamnogalacturonan endolyase
MRASLLFAAVATVRSALAKGPFLQQISSTQWVFGNDVWNLTQGPSYATKLQYQGSDAVKSAPGHYAGLGM